MPIPIINFEPAQASEIELEIINLSDLYERAHELDHNPGEPHRLKFFHLIYINKGNGEHFIDFKSYPCSAGSFLFINIRQVHAFDLVNCPEGKGILFTQQFLDLANTQVRMPFFTANLMNLYSPVFTAKDELKRSCDHLFEEIERELLEDEPNPYIIQFLFSTLLLKLERVGPAFYQERGLTKDQAVKFTEFMALLGDHFATTRDAAAYAEMLAMTYKSLNQICKLACDQTPKQLIDAYTILEAKRRLVIDKVQVSQLTYELGFEGVSNFTKYFKNHTLQTPKQFKLVHSG